MNINTIAWSTGSLLLGALSGTLVTRYILKREMDRQIMEQVAHEKQALHDRYHRIEGERDKLKQENLDLRIDQHHQELTGEYRGLEDVLADPEQAEKLRESLNEAIQTAQNRSLNGGEEEPLNVFKKEDLSKIEGALENDEAFFEGRNTFEIHLISFEEFIDGTEFDKVLVTYYEGDNTLVDESGKVVSRIEENIGTEALVNFGNHSKADDAVYVRNPHTRLDYEIVRHSGHYTQVVLGLEPVDQGAARPKKMRLEE